MSPERRYTFCANLRSRNLCQDFWNGNDPESDAHVAVDNHCIFIRVRATFCCWKTVKSFATGTGFPSGLPLYIYIFNQQLGHSPSFFTRPCPRKPPSSATISFLAFLFEPPCFPSFFFVAGFGGLSAALNRKRFQPTGTRATSCGNLQGKWGAQERVSRFDKSHFMRKFKGKMRCPEWAPSSSTGLYSYRKNPSVRVHCVRNFQIQHQ